MTTNAITSKVWYSCNSLHYIGFGYDIFIEEKLLLDSVTVEFSATATDGKKYKMKFLKKKMKNCVQKLNY